MSKFSIGSEVKVYYNGEIRNASVIRYIKIVDEYVVNVGGSEMYFTGGSIRKWNGN